ncbi:MAG TPA: SRPBCC family protein [Candidatus Saccharimonadales bacterium]|nr:SRPBCC family protein [Candidatus Saccharimonadales bacterium]
MKATFITRVRIAANQELVYEYLTNLKYHQLWNPQTRKISAKCKLQLGSTFTTMSIVLGIKIYAKNIVTKLIEQEEFEIKNVTGTVHYVANFKLKKWLGKTLVVSTTTVYTDSKAFVFTVPIMKRLARRELQTDMQALKIAVENRLQ